MLSGLKIQIAEIRARPAPTIASACSGDRARPAKAATVISPRQVDSSFRRFSMFFIIVYSDDGRQNSAPLSWEQSSAPKISSESSVTDSTLLRMECKSRP